MTHNVRPFRLDGPADGTPVVLINGLFADLHSWDGAMPYLAGCRVLRYNGRGQGAGPHPEGPYVLDTLVADLEDVMDAAAMPKAWLVGISNGGCIALAAAARLPHRVAGLVATACYDRVTPLLRLKIESWLTAHRVGGPTHRFDVAAPWIWSETVLAANPDLPAQYRCKSADLADTAVCGLLEGALTHAVDLKAITAPALLATGAEDVLTTPTLLRDMTVRLPGAVFELLPGAHACLLEQPSLFADPILPFIEAHHGR